MAWSRSLGSLAIVLALGACSSTSSPPASSGGHEDAGRTTKGATDSSPPGSGSPDGSGEAAVPVGEAGDDVGSIQDAGDAGAWWDADDGGAWWDVDDGGAWRDADDGGAAQETSVDAGNCPPCPAATLMCIVVGPGLQTGYMSMPLQVGQCQLGGTVLYCGGSGMTADGGSLSWSVSGSTLAIQAATVLLNCELP